QDPRRPGFPRRERGYYVHREISCGREARGQVVTIPVPRSSSISNIVLPRLYPIIDASCFADTAAFIQFADELLSAGATLLQYRNKTSNPRLMLEQAKLLKDLVGARAKLIMNDRADLC